MIERWRRAVAAAIAGRAGREAASRPAAPPEPAPAADAPQFVPPGHYYSPVPSLTDVRARRETIFDRGRRSLGGIDLREAAQLALLERFAAFYAELPFQAAPTPGRRYHFDNQMYSYADAVFLYCMMRHARPRRVVEIGSGYTSGAMLDVDELFLGGATEFTFIEPYPDRLHGILRAGDAGRVTIVEERLQDVALDCFAALDAGDILFIDSTHVSKAGSDVNHIFFEVLPVLRAGVYVHVHDVFYPFEYPEAWVLEGRQWHENYLLRAFLEFNDTFAIAAFTTFLLQFHHAWFERHMPLCLEHSGGSIWLQRVA
jgi:hypothetical protein